MNDDRLSLLLTTIQNRLVSSIPEMARKLAIKSPVYCLFIWYQDLSVDEYAPEIGVAPVELRDACLGGQHSNKLGNAPVESIWLPQQSIDAPFPGYPFPRKLCEIVAAESNECYSLLTAGLDVPPGPDEEPRLLFPFRAMLHRVAREMNHYRWSGILPCSDDFIVLAADYIGYWLDEDMKASAPAEQLERLRTRGLLPVA